MKLSELLSDYHADLIDRFREAPQKPSDRRGERLYSAKEITQILNDRFQVLLLKVIDLERNGSKERETE